MRITVIGHSTVLFEVAGKRILSDPYFGLHGNPAYRRLAPPARSRRSLLDVDLVLLSHHHWDHTDRRFLRGLAAEVPVLAPARTRWWTRLAGGRSVIGLRAWEERRFGDLTVTAVPALHTTIALGYVLRAAGRSVYFAGDTYHRPFMSEIGRRFDLDAALMPVTTFRIPMTMGEKSAVEAARDLGARVVIPIHLGVEPRLPWLRRRDSPEGFARRVREAGLGCEVVLLREGDCWEPRGEAAPDGDPAAAAVRETVLAAG